MRTRATISGSELLLGVVAIRLAVLVLVGWSLTLLPRQASDSELVCVPAPAMRDEARASAKADGARAADAAFDDMCLHD